MPRRKCAATRANRETVDLAPLLELAPAVAEPPPAPAGVLPLIATAWAEYWHSPLARLVHTASDALALRRLFLLYDEAERGLQAFRAVRVVEGSTGQLKLNPAKDAVDQADILALEDRFGLSPKARLALGVVLGDAARSLHDLAGGLGSEEDDDAPDPRLAAMDR